MLILQLAQNIALLVTLAHIYRVFITESRLEQLKFKLLGGLLFGVVGIIGMMTPLNFTTGIIFDGRSIIISIAGLFGGPVVAAISSVICILYRIILGGSGTLMGVSVTLESAFFGVLFFYFRKFKKIELTLPVLWAFGLVVHITMLLLTNLLPNGAGTQVVQKLGGAIITLHPLGTVFIASIFLDTEKQRKEHLELINSKRDLLKAQQIAQLGSWSWHIPSGQYTWSDEVYKILDIDSAELGGNLRSIFRKHVHPEDHPALFLAAENARNRNLPAPYELRILRADGGIRNVWIEPGELILDAVGKPYILNGIIQDITERKNSENEIRERDDRYRNLIMSSPDAIMVNHQNHIILANEACARLFGAADTSELIGKSPFDLFHPDYHEQIRNRINTLIVEHAPVPLVEEKIIRFDGKVIDVDAVAAPFTFHGADDIHVILRDITDRKKMESALRESYEMLRQLTDQVPGVVYQYRLNPDGSSCFPFSSRGMNEIYEYSPEEVQTDASPVFGRLHPDDYQMISDMIFESARNLTPFHCEFRVILPRQGLRWRISNAMPERLPDGGTLWYGIISDDTVRKLAEDEVRKAKTDIEEAYNATLQGWSNALELRESETAGHSKRVVDMTLQIAIAMGIPDSEMIHLQRGALLHDIGKMGIPDSILLKPGPLTEDEWVSMRQHPVYSYQLLSQIPYLQPALDIPHYHHERWDGSGYPEGLAGESIPIYARIFSVVDVWDALLSQRPYRPAWSVDEVISYLRDQSGKQFDPKVVEVFIRILVE